MVTTENRVAELTRPSSEFPRNFLAEELTLSSWDDVSKYYSDLEHRAIDSVDDLETWIADGSELSSFLSEESSRRYIAMTCSTDDEQAEKDYMVFVEQIAPHLKEAQDKLNRKLVACPFAEQLPPRYEVYLRSSRNAVELFREENIALETELELLSQKYQKIFRL